MKLLETTLGGLRCRVFDQTQDSQTQDSQTQGSQGAGTGPSGLVILCHGYGAPGWDLVGLAPEIVAQRPALGARLRFLFPEAPHPQRYGGQMWWEIDLARLEASIQSGEPRVMRDEVPEGLPAARRSLRALIDEATRQANLPLSRVVLGGFSQGAMLSTDVTLRLDEPPAGLALLSGTLITEVEWRRLAPRRSGLPVLQTHGRTDPILSFGEAEALRALLGEAGLSVDFRPFDGEHTIPEDAVEALARFLEARLG